MPVNAAIAIKCTPYGITPWKQQADISRIDAWPSMCSTIITIVEDEKVEPLLKRLKDLDESYEMLGLRAFVWDIEKTI